ncbi:MAG: hypothetical protein M3237_15260 [Actinomycetota bacterium]|nr:hypothetical protein [Actinomycetota bacterium]
MPKDQIQRSDELIARYAPRAVSERRLSGEHAADARPERLKPTFVFADVAGFTDSSDRRVRLYEVEPAMDAVATPVTVIP